MANLREEVRFMAEPRVRVCNVERTGDEPEEDFARLGRPDEDPTLTS